LTSEQRLSLGTGVGVGAVRAGFGEGLRSLGVLPLLWHSSLGPCSSIAERGKKNKSAALQQAYYFGDEASRLKGLDCF